MISSARSATPMRAHAVMDAARPEAALRDLEAAALAEQQVLDRHLHVLEYDLGMTVRRVVIAEHRQHALDLDAGHVALDQDLRLLAVAVAVETSSCPSRS